ITEPVLDALNLYGLIADDLHTDVVALLVQTQIFKPEQDAHPAGAADAGDRERLATQIFSSFDVRSYYQIVGVAAIKRGDNFEITPRGDGSQNCAAAGTPRYECCQRPCQRPKSARRE